MKLVYKPSDGSGTERVLTEAEAKDLLVEQYGNDDGIAHLNGLLSSQAGTVSVGNGGIFAEA